MPTSATRSEAADSVPAAANSAAQQRRRSQVSLVSAGDILGPSIPSLPDGAKTRLEAVGRCRQDPGFRWPGATRPPVSNRRCTTTSSMRRRHQLSTAQHGNDQVMRKQTRKPSHTSQESIVRDDAGFRTDSAPRQAIWRGEL